MPSTNVPVNLSSATAFATSSAAEGGHTDTMTEACSTIAASVPTSSSPALVARSNDSRLRPSPAQTTRAPLSFALNAIEAPIEPGCRMPTVLPLPPPVGLGGGGGVGDEGVVAARVQPCIAAAPATAAATSGRTSGIGIGRSDGRWSRRQTPSPTPDSQGPRIPH